MRSPIVFGAKGTDKLTIDPAAAPFEYRGCYTGKLYAWTARRPVRAVDRRDVPGLIKDHLTKFPALAPPPAPVVPVKTKKPRAAAPPVSAPEGGIDE